MEDLGDKLTLWIPVQRIYPLIIVLGGWSFLWLCLGTLFLFSVNSSNQKGEFDPSLILTGIIPWFIVGALLVYMLARQFFGKEKIEVTNQSIKISQNVLGINFPKEYLAEHIKNLDLARVSLSDLTSWGRNAILWDFGVGLISFDYGAKTIKFAGGIFDAEAKQIIAEIQQRFPQYKN